MTHTIFVSSVQSEFASERRAIKDYVVGDPLLSRHFDVFIFEDTPAETRSPEEVFLDEVDRCFVYLGLFGESYGGVDVNGISATEREFDRAVLRRKERLVFHRAGTSAAREEKQRTFVAKADLQLTRRSFRGVPDLQGQLYASLVGILENEGLISTRPFDARAARSATVDDLDQARVAAFVGKAGKARNFSLKRAATVPEALEHMNLMVADVPSNAALLLFTPLPKRFVDGAFVTCLHFAGSEIVRPALSQNVLDGPLFEQIDAAVSFVMSRLSRPVGTRETGAAVETAFEIPQAAVAEAIVNALAHRDYASRSAVHIRLLADRVEVASPGQLPRSLTPEHLKRAHPSIPGNPLVAEALFLAGYVERAGTGTLDMVAQCRAAGLPEPDFFQDGGDWTVRLWRDWLTEEFMARLPISDRQKRAMARIKARGTIDNRSYQEAFGASERSASRELKALADLGLLIREGTTGRATRYRRAARKPAMNPPNPPTRPKGGNPP